MTRRNVTLVTAALLLIALTAVAVLLPVPYVTMRPGPTFDTLGEFEDKPILEFPDDIKTYPTDGELRLTTVSVTRADSRISLAQAFQAYFDGDEAVVPRDVVYPPGQTAEQSVQQNAQLMATSKETSEAAALTLAGYDVGTVVKAASVVDGGPADGIIEPNDEILAVDGKKITEPQDAIDAVSAKSPGDTVEVTIRRDGKRQTVDVKTGKNPDAPDQARIGVGLGTDVDLPFTITNNVGKDIGGPSAGTMFALAIYDELTPGELTGGKTIAGTGEIDADGNVGRIGGIGQKIAGAADAGATVFLVPSGNCDEAAQSDDHGLELVRVSTLEDAVDALDSLAEDPAAKVPTCS